MLRGITRLSGVVPLASHRDVKNNFCRSAAPLGAVREAYAVNLIRVDVQRLQRLYGLAVGWTGVGVKGLNTVNLEDSWALYYGRAWGCRRARNGRGAEFGIVFIVGGVVLLLFVFGTN
eukprot:1182938-Prorocentrum_minimum.AAC.2